MDVCGWGLEECGDDTNLLHIHSLFLKDRKQVHISHHYKLPTTARYIQDIIVLGCCLNAGMSYQRSAI